VDRCRLFSRGLGTLPFSIFRGGYERINDFFPALENLFRQPFVLLFLQHLLLVRDNMLQSLFRQGDESELHDESGDVRQQSVIQFRQETLGVFGVEIQRALFAVQGIRLGCIGSQFLNLPVAEDRSNPKGLARSGKCKMPWRFNRANVLRQLMS